MGYGLILCGIAFLIVPSFGVYDFMPDVFGYALILAGLAKTARLNGDLQSSRKNFKYLFFLTLAKLILLYPLVGLHDEMTAMLYVFCFAIAESVFLILAFSSLCEGSYYLSSRAGCNVSDKAQSDFSMVCRFFIIGRALLASAPELTVLTNRKYTETMAVEDFDKPTLYESKNIITLACFIISLLIGIVFYILAVRYFVPLIKDKTSRAEIKQRYDEEITSNQAKRVYTSVKSASALFTFACLFMATLYFYGFDILIDFIAAALTAAGFLMLKTVIDTKKAVILSAVFAVITAASFGLEFYTAKKYFTDASYITEASVNAYIISATVKAVGFAVFAALIYYLYRCLRIIIKKHTKSPTFDEEGYKKKLYNKCRLLCAVGIAACGISAAAGFLFAYSELFRFVGLICFGAYTVYLYVTTTKLCEELSRYI